MSFNPSTAVVIPTLNAANTWTSLHEGLQKQTYRMHPILVVDSASTDGTAELARAAGYDVVLIARAEFSHGGTRQDAANLLVNAEIIVYLTQDAILSSPDAISKLIEPFADPMVGATFGRQIPRQSADPIEAHARIFNYPDKSSVRTWSDRGTMGIRAAFLSNSFAAYRRSALIGVGGFPINTITAEDTLVAARMLMSGWKTAYVADAVVIHSHAYSITEEFRRYFDTGVYHHRERWLLQQFGKPTGEGKRFVLSELHALWPRYVYMWPLATLRTFSKALAYYLGLNETRLNARLRRMCSLNRGYWNTAALIPQNEPKRLP